MAIRFRPRFSIRTLAIFVTLICAYFGAWEATKKYGVPSPEDHGYFGHMFRDPFRPSIATSEEPKALMPFIVRYGTVHEFEFPVMRGYYLWLLGPKIKLPFESDGLD